MRQFSGNLLVPLVASCVLVGLSAGGLSLWWNRIGWCPWLQDVALNVAVTALAIPVTALLVEWIIDLNDRRRWAKIVERGRVKAVGLAYAVADAIAFALGVEKVQFEPGLPLTSDQAVFYAQNRAMLRLIEEQLSPRILEMGRVPSDRGRTLLVWFSNLHNEANQILVLYGRWLSIDTQDLILNLENQLGNTRIHFPALWAGQLGVDQFRGSFGVHQPQAITEPGSVVALETGLLLEASLRILRSAVDRPDLSGI